MKPFTYRAKSMQDKEKLDNIRADIISQLPPGLKREAKVKDLVFVPNGHIYDVHFDDASAHLRKYTSRLRIIFAKESKN